MQTEGRTSHATSSEPPVIRASSDSFSSYSERGFGSVMTPQCLPEENKRIRVGAVSYLNTKPLVYRLAEFYENCELSFDLPSRLADQLAAGQIDVGLIPSFEAFQRADYRIVSDACIACCGPVWSVKLLSRKPFSQIGSMATDAGSRTSVGLARVLLSRRFQIEPELVPFPIEQEVSDVRADSVLIIGDRAMHDSFAGFPYVWDLGGEWVSETGLPFVFAMWVGRVNQDFSRLERGLETARDAGLLNLKHLASVSAAQYRLTEDQCVRYWRDNLYFTLGQEQRAGLELYHRHLAELGLAPKKLELFQDGFVHSK